MKEDLLIGKVLEIRALQNKIGARKMHWMLCDFRKQHNIEMGRDAFFILLKKHQLLIRKRKSHKPITTQSNHWFRKYKNLIIDFVPIGPNQLWVSDITYIRVNKNFAYLSLITDAYSRKIVGYHLYQSLAVKGPLNALFMALKSIKHIALNNRWLIHHSDRGVQYACYEYTDILNANGIRISMTQSGDPLENAIAERINGILKNELLTKVHDSFSNAKSAIKTAISTYNYLRPHGSIEMLTPDKAHVRKGNLKRTWKNYYKKKYKQEILLDN